MECLLHDVHNYSRGLEGMLLLDICTKHMLAQVRHVLQVYMGAYTQIDRSLATQSVYKKQLSTIFTHFIRRADGAHERAHIKL